MVECMGGCVGARVCGIAYGRVYGGGGDHEREYSVWARIVHGSMRRQEYSAWASA